MSAYQPYSGDTRELQDEEPGSAGSIPADGSGSPEKQGDPGSMSDSAGLAQPAPTGKGDAQAQARRPEKGRRAHLTVSRVEPWSAMKFSFVTSLVCFIVLFVAVAILYGVLSLMGVFDALSATVGDLTTSGDSGGVDVSGWFAASRVLGYTALVGAINVILISALATVGAVIYNQVADLVGGVEVTLSEAE